MMNKLLRALTAGTLALFTVAPAFAVCNPGTPHCIKVDPSLARIKNKIFTPGTLGSDEQQCQSKLCGIDTGDGTSPGTLARTGKPATPSIPIPPPGGVQVR